MSGISCNGIFRSFSNAPNCRASGFTICVTLQQLWRSVPAFPPRLSPKQLGHASVAFTLDTYSHVLPHMQEAAAAQVEALLSESAPKKRGARKTKRGTTHKARREHKTKG